MSWERGGNDDKGNVDKVISERGHRACLLEHVVDEAGIYTYQHADSKHDLTMLR